MEKAAEILGISNQPPNIGGLCTHLIVPPTPLWAKVQQFADSHGFGKRKDSIAVLDPTKEFSNGCLQLIVNRSTEDADDSKIQILSDCLCADFTQGFHIPEWPNTAALECDKTVAHLWRQSRP